MPGKTIYFIKTVFQTLFFVSIFSKIVLLIFRADFKSVVTLIFYAFMQFPNLVVFFKILNTFKNLRTDVNFMKLKNSDLNIRVSK